MSTTNTTRISEPYDSIKLADSTNEVGGGQASSPHQHVDTIELADLAEDLGAQKASLALPAPSKKISSLSAHPLSRLVNTPLLIPYENYVRTEPARGTAMLEIEKAKAYANWMNNITSIVAYNIYPEANEDVMYVVRNTQIFPTPVRAIGYTHSPSKCLANDHGTNLCMTKLNKVLALDIGALLVTVQAGIKMSDLHAWLAAYGYEIAFAPEIGDASVGGLVCHTNKDSSYDAMGTLQSIVRKITYVDENAALVTLSTVERDHTLNMDALLQVFMCSAGLLGIVVEVTLEIRRREKMLTTMKALPISTPNFTKKIVRKLERHNNIFMFLSPRNNICTLECRDGDKHTMSTLINPINCRIMHKVKYDTFLSAKSPYIANILKYISVQSRTYRSFYVNSYPAFIPEHKGRLTFFLIEFDFLSFERVINDVLVFHTAHKASTGFEPEGYAIYFVTRTGKKPTGNFSGAPGKSFCLDPIYSKPNDPAWIAYQQAVLVWAKAYGAKLSLNQSGDPPPGFGAEITLPSSMRTARFANEWLEKFVIWS